MPVAISAAQQPKGIEMTSTEAKVVRTEGRKVFLLSVFTTALEGGIGYWSYCEQYHWANEETGGHPAGDIDGFYATLTSTEEDWGVMNVYQPHLNSPEGDVVTMTLETQNQRLRVDIDVIERGVNLLVDKVIEATKSEDHSAPFSYKYLRQFVEAWLTDGESGDFDADGADLAVQLGLFGEHVYG
jgi:hypothetical protein